MVYATIMKPAYSALIHYSNTSDILILGSNQNTFGKFNIMDYL
jgi:hypothetical protein